MRRLHQRPLAVDRAESDKSTISDDAKACKSVTYGHRSQMQTFRHALFDGLDMCGIIYGGEMNACAYESPDILESHQ